MALHTIDDPIACWKIEMPGGVMEDSPLPPLSEPSPPFPPPPPPPASSATPIPRIPERPVALQGTTYKLKTPQSAHAWYVTLNNCVVDGEPRLFEIFINCRDTRHYQWVAALSRTISAVCRIEKDPSFLVEELKSIVDPSGGYFADGGYVPSLIAGIGNIVERYLKATLPQERPAATPQAVAAASDPPLSASPLASLHFTPCPQCNAPLIAQSGCETCTQCTYSRCG